MSRTCILFSACFAFGFIAYSNAMPDQKFNNDNNNSFEKLDNDTDRVGSYAQASSMGVAQRPQNTQYAFVECYSCTDCPTVDEMTPTKWCPVYSDVTPRCLVYAEKYRYLDRPWYIRGCTTEKGTCAEIRKAHAQFPDIVKLLFCEECDGNLCNTTSGATMVDATIAFIMLVVTPVLTKFTLT
ncbi:uncharacterized protein LOC123697968 [Colias croceus]|uniref:uncharacterized protein LOC123697968 n=1 Tax=Colias crocea TaxID=72248 RepID=UPI001E27E92A|nr:uncharacterized protein LOC123697968 [Colias croceus]